MMQLRFRDAEHLSHAYILSAQDPRESLRAAEQLAAAAVCSDTRQVPCGRCRACRKVSEGMHPDVLRVGRLEDDKGRKKREIGVDQIRRMAADAVVLPNEAERKVYVIEDADRMNIAAQNAALKLLEEPPRGVIFLLCVQNAQSLLPTVRSRCVELKLGGEEAEADAESRKLARAYVKLAAEGDRAAVFRWCAAHDGLDSRAAADFFDALSAQLSDMICARQPDLGLDRRDLRRLLTLSERCGACLRVNVGVKHLFGLLAVDAVGGGNRG